MACDCSRTSLALSEIGVEVGRFQVLPGLAQEGYVRSHLHSDSCAWVEKNCYIDVWIEVLHSLGVEPAAVLSMTLAVDFEGDQWTFFKPPHDELRELYGIDVQELTVWRTLLAHAAEHLAAGKLISTEADAFWLPDTAGTDYRTQHTKSTIVLADIDLANERLGYFHNAGYYDLEGEDYRQLFRVGHARDPSFLPLYAELVRIDRLVHRSDDVLRGLARPFLVRHLDHRPTKNPLRSFQHRLERELVVLQSGELSQYHLWAFATIRQLGAAFELAAAHIRWAWPTGGEDVERATAGFEVIARVSKTLILKVARAVNSGRMLDASALFDEMATAWSGSMDAVSRLTRT